MKLAGGINGYRYVPNPTGWVDPLGLNNCPGTGDCESTVSHNAPERKASADDRSPSLPQPTRAERQVRIPELAEENAKKRVESIQNQYDMHTIDRHSPEITDTALTQRAIDGTDPGTGLRRPHDRGNVSSQFHSWRLQLSALNKALTRESLGLDPFNGKDLNNKPILKLELPGAGRGYRPNRRNPQATHLNENLNWFEVKFDKDDNTKPFTAFPAEKK